VLSLEYQGIVRIDHCDINENIFPPCAERDFSFVIDKLNNLSMFDRVERRLWDWSFRFGINPLALQVIVGYGGLGAYVTYSEFKKLLKQTPLEREDIFAPSLLQPTKSRSKLRIEKMYGRSIPGMNGFAPLPKAKEDTTVTSTNEMRKKNRISSGKSDVKFQIFPGEDATVGVAQQPTFQPVKHGNKLDNKISNTGRDLSKWVPPPRLVGVEPNPGPNGRKSRAKKTKKVVIQVAQNQPKRKKRTRRNRSGGGMQVIAPPSSLVNIPRRFVTASSVSHQGSHGLQFRGCQRICDVSVIGPNPTPASLANIPEFFPAAGQTTRRFPTNPTSTWIDFDPSNLLPPLATNGALYQQYRWVNATLHWNPTCGANTTGQLVLAYSRDACVRLNATKDEMAALADSVEIAPWATFNLPLTSLDTTMKYSFEPASSSDADRRLSDGGMLGVSGNIPGYNTTTGYGPILGSLYLTYTVQVFSQAPLSLLTTVLNGLKLLKEGGQVVHGDDGWIEPSPLPRMTPQTRSLIRS